jgi:hypothetical protein
MSLQEFAYEFSISEMRDSVNKLSGGCDWKLNYYKRYQIENKLHGSRYILSST